MRKEGLCPELIRGIQRYFASLPFDQGVHAHQSGFQPKFSGLCTRKSHLVVFSSINRNLIIGCYNFVQIKVRIFSEMIPTHCTVCFELSRGEKYRYVSSPLTRIYVTWTAGLGSWLGLLGLCTDLVFVNLMLDFQFLGCMHLLAAS